MTSDEEFLIKLMATFKIEAEEHISSISNRLVEFEKEISDNDKQKIIEIVYRDAHSLKGAARSVDLALVESMCQAMENLLSLLKKGELLYSPYISTSLHDANDFVRMLLFENIIELNSENKLIMETIKENLTRAAKKIEPLPLIKKTITDESLPLPQTVFETVRVSVDKLETVLTGIEEIISSKLVVKHHALIINQILLSLEEWQNKTNETQFLSHEINHYINSIKDDLQSTKKIFDEDARLLAGKIDDLYFDMKKILLFPFSYSFEILPKLVRDMAVSQNKEIELILEGEEIEIDKRILQAIKDPLIHIIRNSIDHGIEIPAERVELNKAVKGTIKISVTQIDVSKIEIRISDDGAGINAEKVKNSAVKQGIITIEEANLLPDEQIINLIFETGISTSAKISTISGRGLGMAIVKEKVEKLGGNYSVNSIINQGTEFVLTLPVTISSFRGILINVNNQNFIMPTKNVVKIIRIPLKDIKTVENRETILYEDNVISLIYLSEILELPQITNQDKNSYINVLIVPNDKKQIAFVIDSVLKEEEMLLKSLGSQLVRVSNILGASILGNGTIVPVLNITDLLKSSLNTKAKPVNLILVDNVKKEIIKKQILVVDDSITARSLVVNILESENYKVMSAVDGIDALLKLVDNDFDLVVSDVEMPRMNGFELTKKIRSEAKYANLPVVLVTGLESLDDKKRGVEAGANAYIVKSSFDQNDLLEVVSRLI